jgi:NCS2 family nucleobase:cation symporter-2
MRTGEPARDRSELRRVQPGPACSYDGPPLDLPERRPTNEEIIADEDGARRLAGFLLRKYADRVQATHKAGRSTIIFHFDH